MERYKRLRKEKFIRRIKFFIIFLIISVMSCGLYIVNNSIKDLDLIENDNLIRIDRNNNTIDLLGKSYYIDFQIIKKVFKH